MNRSLFVLVAAVSILAASPSIAAKSGLLTISIFPGTTGAGGVDAPQLEKRYAPLMKYLREAKVPTVFLPAPSVDVAKSDLSGGVDLVLAPIQIAAPALKAGWTPLAVRADKIRAGIYVRADSDIKSTEDLSGKRIALPDAKTLIAIEAKSVLTSAKIEADLMEKPGDQKLLLRTALELRQFDAVAVRDTVAGECLKAKTCRLVIAHAGYPGFVLMAKDPSNPQVAAAAKAFLALDQTKHEELLLGLDGAKKGPKAPSGFSAPTVADVDAIRNF